MVRGGGQQTEISGSEMRSALGCGRWSGSPSGEAQGRGRSGLADRRVGARPAARCRCRSGRDRDRRKGRIDGRGGRSRRAGHRQRARPVARGDRGDDRSGSGRGGGPPRSTRRSKASPSSRRWPSALARVRPERPAARQPVVPRPRSERSTSGACGCRSTPVRVAVIDSGHRRRPPRVRRADRAGESFVKGPRAERGHDRSRNDGRGRDRARSTTARASPASAFPAELLVAKVVGAGRRISLEAEAKAIRWAVDAARG